METGRTGTAASSSRVTIAEVASSAGVSPTTVSHVLSGKRTVGARTRATVLEAIDELGYRPNHVARNLRTRRSHMIAAVVPDITDAFFGRLTRGLADALDPAGYGVVVCNTDGRHERERRFFDDALDRGVDGIVFASGEARPEVTFAPAAMATPVVSVGGRLDHPRCDTVRADDAARSRTAVDHLVDDGRERIAMVQGPPRSPAARAQGFRSALHARGRTASPRMLVRGDWTRAGGAAAMRTLMELPHSPDAVLCANDEMALGALDVLSELGLSAPGDVAVMGFEDADEKRAAVVHAPLSTVRSSPYDAGRAAGDLLMSRMSGRYDGAGRTVALPCAVVSRGSA